MLVFLKEQSRKMIPCLTLVNIHVNLSTFFAVQKLQPDQIQQQKNKKISTDSKKKKKRKKELHCIVGNTPPQKLHLHKLGTFGEFGLEVQMPRGHKSIITVIQSYRHSP